MVSGFCRDLVGEKKQRKDRGAESEKIFWWRREVFFNFVMVSGPEGRLRLYAQLVGGGGGGLEGGKNWFWNEIVFIFWRDLRRYLLCGDSQEEGFRGGEVRAGERRRRLKRGDLDGGGGGLFRDLRCIYWGWKAGSRRS